MTLDEAIKRAEEAAEENQRVVDKRLVDTGIVFDGITIDMLFCDDTEVIEEHLANYQRCAEEHRQLAEWLKDYKRLLEQVPYGDAISRQAVWDVMQELWGTSGELLDRLMALPPVTPQPKMGYWIKIKSGDKDFPESIVCSRCGNENSHLDFNENAEPIGKVFVTSKFCPNCGIRMVNPQEMEDKE